MKKEEIIEKANADFLNEMLDKLAAKDGKRIKKKMGRPTVPEDQKRFVVKSYFNQEEMEDLRSISSEFGLTNSETILKLVLEYAKKFEKV